MGTGKWPDKNRLVAGWESVSCKLHNNSFCVSRTTPIYKNNNIALLKLAHEGYEGKVGKAVKKDI